MSFSYSKLLCTFDCIKMNFSKDRKHKNSRCVADLPEGFTLTYHAGAMHTEINTLQSISAAVEHGAKVVEFDVSFRPDGTPVIIHDSAPAQNQGVLLKDALEIVEKRKNCKINLDIKSTANLPAVDRLVKDADIFDRVFYTGVLADWIETVKNTSSIPYYLNHGITDEEAADPCAAQAVADKAKALGAMGINSSFVKASRMFVKKMNENGLPVSLWTVNKPADMVKVIDLKPQNITTQNPHIFNMLVK